MNPFSPPAAKPVLDPVGALVALGDLAGACDRRCLSDVLAAWRDYVEAMHRRDLLRIEPLFAAVPVAIDREGFAHLAALATATARNLHALDAERHWRVAAQTFQQAAVNAASIHGGQVAALLEEWQRVGWTDEDGDALREIGEDLLASSARQAAHYATFALPPWRSWASDAESRASGARAAVDAAIERALREGGLLTIANDEPICELCGGDLTYDGVEAHGRACPLFPLSAANLLAVYRDALQGRL